jgi:hypothetical protein
VLRWKPTPRAEKALAPGENPAATARPATHAP